MATWDLEWTALDPSIVLMEGQACIRGMRVTVALILNLVANGMAEEEILKEYLYLEPEVRRRGDVFQ